MKISSVIKVVNIEEVGDSGCFVAADTRAQVVTIRLDPKSKATKLELNSDELLSLLLRAHPRFGYNFGFVPPTKI